ncbi:hypothetical protein DPMN_193759 [Dreissena polymorpha]|uniref:Uncharacterized protein n=1 Tax=Dreissena polymorpha TaxID=45954 RepID=A0A9D3Y013_DREPO|nr:hypothetical protein DPMN_193759 [Dreissena polymorpha]
MAKVQTPHMARSDTAGCRLSKYLNQGIPMLPPLSDRHKRIKPGVQIFISTRQSG